jgi:hypothetical protein
MFAAGVGRATHLSAYADAAPATFFYFISLGETPEELNIVCSLL